MMTRSPFLVCRLILSLSVFVVVVSSSSSSSSPSLLKQEVQSTDIDNHDANVVKENAIIGSKNSNIENQTLLSFHQNQQDSHFLEVKDHHHNHHDHHDDDHKKKDTNHHNNSFCQGSFSTMFMDGFRWSLKNTGSGSSSSHNHHDHNSTDNNNLPPCLAYYVSSWKLNMSGKFRGAMVFSFLLAFLTEALSASRFVLIQFLHHSGTTTTTNTTSSSSDGDITTTIPNSRNKRTRKEKLLLTFVYALQQWMGTMIMLISMMYSIEMLLSVIVGLMIGNYLFGMKDQQNLYKQQQQNQYTIVAANNNNNNSNMTINSGLLNNDNDIRNSSPPTSGRVSLRRNNNNNLIGTAGSGDNNNNSIVEDHSCCDTSSTGGLQLQMQPPRKED